MYIYKTGLHLELGYMCSKDMQTWPFGFAVGSQGTLQ